MIVQHMRPITAQLALYIGVVFACVMLVAIPSGCGANQRTKTIQSSILAVNAARDGWVAWDRAAEHAIVEKAKPPSEGGTKAEADAAIAAYRVKSAPIWSSFEVTYRALAVAATQTDDRSLKAALAEIPKLVEAIKQLTGGP